MTGWAKSRLGSSRAQHFWTPRGRDNMMMRAHCRWQPDRHFDHLNWDSWARKCGHCEKALAAEEAATSAFLDTIVG